MEKDTITNRLQAVINTLNAMMLRADQMDAMQRVNICCRELVSIIKDMESKEETKDEAEEG